jgi:hypothetical protein
VRAKRITDAWADQKIVRERLAPITSILAHFALTAGSAGATTIVAAQAAASISVRLVRGMRPLIGCSLTFLALFVGHVMADGATAGRPNDAMLADPLPVHAADQRALETAFCFG